MTGEEALFYSTIFTFLDFMLTVISEVLKLSF